MKKYLFISLILCLLLTGCGDKTEHSKTTKTNAKVATVGDNEGIDNNTDETLDNVDQQYLRAGTWRLYKNDVCSGYISFDSGKYTGVYLNIDDDTREDISYFLKGTEIALLIGTDEYDGFVEQQDEDTFFLTIAEDNIWKFDYVSDKLSEDFTYYDDSELITLALNYYEAQKKYRPSQAEVKNNDDGTVTIHLFDIIDGYTSSIAWYTVERIGAFGSDDITGNKIDLDGEESSQTE